MISSWDVIVVGSGLGGLTAAARLSRQGLKVLVLDQNPHPGGTAYTFTRHGYWFPMGPLGVSSPDLVRTALDQAGADSDLVLSPVRYALHAFGLKVGLSQGYEQLRRELARSFPAEDQGLGRFFAHMEELGRALQDPDANQELLESRSAVATADYLGGLIEDWRLRRVLGSQGTREPYSSVVLTAAMWGLISQVGIWLPQGGVKAIAGRLATALEEQGGVLRLGVEVRRIVVESGRALGVVLAGGSFIAARAVVSNADYKRTFGDLMEPDAAPAEFMEALRAARQTGSVLQVSLGIDRSRADLSAFAEASRILYRREGAEDAPDPLWEAPEIAPGSLAEQELEISLWSADQEAVAPPGHGAIVIRVEAGHGHFERFHQGRRKRTPEYGDYKRRLARALVKEAERVLPGLESSIKVMDVSTPLTFRDQGGRTGGAVAGWSWDYDDDHDWRPRDLTVTPVQGLYMAGYQARSALYAGGAPTAMMSGLDAARAVMDGRPPADRVLIPTPRRT